MTNNMKNLLHIFLLAVLATAVVSCGKDNYDQPESSFAGKVVYDGQPLGVRGSNGDVYLQFWQSGYELNTSFNVYVAQDGSYSAMLFDGVYKLVMNSNRGPWVNSPDTVTVEVNGATVKDYPVTPYYTISNATYSLSGTMLTASFDVAEVTAGRNIEYVALMVNKNKFVDFGDGTHVAWVRNESAVPGHISLQLDVTGALNEQVELYARVGLKITGIDQGLYDHKVERVK